MAFVARGINTVRTVGNQSVSGVKTFSSSPKVPNATSSQQAVNKGQLDEKAANTEVVKITGNQSIAGIKTFTGTTIFNANSTDVRLVNRLTDYTKGTAPENVQWAGIKIIDNTNNEIADFHVSISTNNTANASLILQDPGSGTSTAAIRLYYPENGTPYTSAPSPTDTTTTSGSQIATTGWVNSTGNNIVHITKAETITGSKTFTSPILTVSDNGTMFDMQCSDLNCVNYVGSTTNKYCGFFDTNNVLLSGLQLHYTANESTIRLLLRKQTDTTTSAANLSYLGLKFATTGNAYGLAPDFLPISDNTYTLGNGSYRWKQLFAGTATISTSDERCKQSVDNVPDSVLNAWGEVGFYQFKFNDSVAEKGDAARLHTGMIAQRIDEVFSAHGLNAAAYGLFCYDEWEAEPAELDDDGKIITPAKEAGNRYSLRYEECLCMEAAYQRRRADRIEARLRVLENELKKLVSNEV